jgi:hypothetical protein
VIGGGLAGATVVLSEATGWPGGQVTSQGVSALDEHEHIESFGVTRSYYRPRNGIRAFYQERYDGPATMPHGASLNPGNGWVNRLCFEPRVGLQVLEDLLSPYVAAKQLAILLCHRPISVAVEDDRVTEVRLRSDRDDVVRVRAFAERSAENTWRDREDQKESGS